MEDDEWKTGEEVSCWVMYVGVMYVCGCDVCCVM